MTDQPTAGVALTSASEVMDLLRSRTDPMVKALNRAQMDDADRIELAYALIADRKDRAEALATPASGPVEADDRLAVAALRGLLQHVDDTTCTHEETKRGGAIWTICEGCGRKWADDEGGFVPHQDAPAVATAREALALLTKSGEAEG